MQLQPIHSGSEHNPYGAIIRHEGNMGSILVRPPFSATREVFDDVEDGGSVHLRPYLNSGDATKLKYTIDEGLIMGTGEESLDRVVAVTERLITALGDLTTNGFSAEIGNIKRS